MTGEGFDLLQNRLSAKLSRDEGYSLDPTVLIAIIGAIIPLIQNCFNATPAGLRRRFLNRARVATKIVEARPMPFVEAFRHADTLFDLAAEASDKELQSLIDDCCKET